MGRLVVAIQIMDTSTVPAGRVVIARRAALEVPEAQTVIQDLMGNLVLVAVGAAVSVQREEKEAQVGSVEAEVVAAQGPAAVTVTEAALLATEAVRGQKGAAPQVLEAVAEPG